MIQFSFASGFCLCFLLVWNTILPILILEEVTT